MTSLCILEFGSVVTGSQNIIRACRRAWTWLVWLEPWPVHFNHVRQSFIFRPRAIEMWLRDNGELDASKTSTHCKLDWGGTIGAICMRDGTTPNEKITIINRTFRYAFWKHEHHTKSSSQANVKSAWRQWMKRTRDKNSQSSCHRSYQQLWWHIRSMDYVAQC